MLPPAVRTAATRSPLKLPVGAPSCGRTLVRVRGFGTPTFVARSVVIRPRVVMPVGMRSLVSSSVCRDAWSDKKDVTYNELKPLTEQPTGEVTLIDVREPNETQAGMIPSAVNLPLSEIAPALKAAEDERQTKWFLGRFTFDPPGHNDKIIVYCRSGKRSQQALDHFAKHKFNNVRNYRGSWQDWTDHKAKGQ